MIRWFLKLVSKSFEQLSDCVGARRLYIVVVHRVDRNDDEEEEECRASLPPDTSWERTRSFLLTGLAHGNREDKPWDGDVSKSRLVVRSFPVVVRFVAGTISHRRRDLTVVQDSCPTVMGDSFLLLPCISNRPRTVLKSPMECTVNREHEHMQSHGKNLLVHK